MIPYAILHGVIYDDFSEPYDIRVLELSEDQFTIRLSRKREMKNTAKITLYFYEFMEDVFKKTELGQCTLKPMEETEYYTVYRIRIQNTAFQNSARKLIQEYSDYINLKLESEDSHLSQQLTGYPANKESIFSDNYEQWKAKMFSLIRERWSERQQDANAFTRQAWIPSAVELAVELDRPMWWELFEKQSLPEFEKMFWEKSSLHWHPIANQKISCVYIGSQFCAKGFRECERWGQLLLRALQWGLKPVIVLPPISQDDFAWYCELISGLNALWCEKRKSSEKLEIVINDWGIGSWIRQRIPETCSLIMGIHLNKRRKDVRMQYKNSVGKMQSLLTENAFNDSDWNSQVYRLFHSETYSYESCGYPFTMAQGKHILHMPFFQMNTSTHCTLYALCRNGERGKLEYIENCPGYCEQKVFLYPDFLHMVGFGNSLFGFDDKSLWDKDYLDGIIGPETVRVVVRGV